MQLTCDEYAELKITFNINAIKREKLFLARRKLGHKIQNRTSNLQLIRVKRVINRSNSSNINEVDRTCHNCKNEQINLKMKLTILVITAKH